MANTAIVVTGIVILFLGIIGFFYPIWDRGFTAPQIHQICSTDWVQFGLMFDTEGNLRQLCNTFSILTTAIYGFGIVGIIMIIVGAVKKSKQSSYVCGHCDFIGTSEEVLWNHYNEKHPDEKKW